MGGWWSIQLYANKWCSKPAATATVSLGLPGFANRELPVAVVGAKA